MATVESITISGTAYDVYGTEADIKAYLAGRLGTTAYDDASATDRKKAHVQATRWIDRENWAGDPTDLTTPQPLSWPRTGVTDCEGNAVLPTVVPDDLCNAVAELILILLDDSSATSKSTQGSNIKSVEAGSAKVSFFRPGAADGSGSSSGVFPTEAQKLLRCFLEGSIGLLGPTTSGTGVDSAFSCDDFGLNEGMA